MEEQSQHKAIHVFEEASNAESRIGGQSSKKVWIVECIAGQYWEE